MLFFYFIIFYFLEHLFFLYISFLLKLSHGYNPCHISKWAYKINIFFSLVTSLLPFILYDKMAPRMVRLRVLEAAESSELILRAEVVLFLPHVPV